MNLQFDTLTQKYPTLADNTYFQNLIAKSKSCKLIEHSGAISSIVYEILCQLRPAEAGGLNIRLQSRF